MSVGSHSGNLTFQKQATSCRYRFSKPRSQSTIEGTHQSSKMLANIRKLNVPPNKLNGIPCTPQRWQAAIGWFRKPNVCFPSVWSSRGFWYSRNVEHLCTKTRFPRSSWNRRRSSRFFTQHQLYTVTTVRSCQVSWTVSWSYYCSDEKQFHFHLEQTSVHRWQTFTFVAATRKK